MRGAVGQIAVGGDQVLAAQVQKTRPGFGLGLRTKGDAVPAGAQLVAFDIREQGRIGAGTVKGGVEVRLRLDLEPGLLSGQGCSKTKGQKSQKNG